MGILRCVFGLAPIGIDLITKTPLKLTTLLKTGVEVGVCLVNEFSNKSLSNYPQSVNQKISKFYTPNTCKSELMNYRTPSINWDFKIADRPTLDRFKREFDERFINRLDRPTRCPYCGKITYGKVCQCTGKFGSLGIMRKIVSKAC